MPGMSINAGNSPCRYCERRHPGCHTICTDYKKYRAEQDKKMAERHVTMNSTPNKSPHVKQWLKKQMMRKNGGY